MGLLWIGSFRGTVCSVGGFLSPLALVWCSGAGLTGRQTAWRRRPASTRSRSVAKIGDARFAFREKRLKGSPAFGPGILFFCPSPGFHLNATIPDVLKLRVACHDRTHRVLPFYDQRRKTPETTLDGFDIRSPLTTPSANTHDKPPRYT